MFNGLEKRVNHITLDFANLWLLVSEPGFFRFLAFWSFLRFLDVFGPFSAPGER